MTKEECEIETSKAIMEMRNQIAELEKENAELKSKNCWKTCEYAEPKSQWFVANDNGDIIGHDMGEAKAKALAAEMQEEEPDAGWEAMNGDGE